MEGVHNLTAPGRRGLGILTVGFGLLGASVVGAVESSAEVIEVTDISSCANLAEHLESPSVWRGIRLDTPRAGIHSDGIVSVEVTAFLGSKFDWSSDVSLDAVLLGYESASGQETGQLAFRYDPEANSDLEVGVEELHPGSRITEITFCHDPDDGPPEDSASSTTTSSTTSTTEVVTTTSVAVTTSTISPPEDGLAQTGSEDVVLAGIGLTLVALGTGIVLSVGNAYRRVYY